MADEVEALYKAATMRMWTLRPGASEDVLVHAAQALRESEIVNKNQGRRITLPGPERLRKLMAATERWRTEGIYPLDRIVSGSEADRNAMRSLASNPKARAAQRETGDLLAVKAALPEDARARLYYAAIRPNVTHQVRTPESFESILKSGAIKPASQLATEGVGFTPEPGYQADKWHRDRVFMAVDPVTASLNDVGDLKANKITLPRQVVLRRSVLEPQLEGGSRNLSYAGVVDLDRVNAVAVVRPQDLVGASKKLKNPDREFRSIKAVAKEKRIPVIDEEAWNLMQEASKKSRYADALRSRLGKAGLLSLTALAMGPAVARAMEERQRIAEGDFNYRPPAPDEAAMSFFPVAMPAALAAGTLDALARSRAENFPAPETAEPGWRAAPKYDMPRSDRMMRLFEEDGQRRTLKRLLYGGPR